MIVYYAGITPSIAIGEPTMNHDAAIRLFDKIRHVCPDAPDKFIVVNTALQLLTLIKDTRAQRTFTISTSKFGIGNRENSMQTPTGLHRVAEMIGDGAPAGRIFKDRCDTGVDSLPDSNSDNLIVTRILRLEGLEPGVNRGPGIDSYERYIYIHGTDKESAIGTPLSHGCILMKSADIIELFNTVKEGTIVNID